MTTRHAHPLPLYPVVANESEVDCSAYNVRDDLKSKSMEEVKRIQEENTRDFCCMALNTIGSLNTGTLIRTAVIYGAREFFVIGRRRFDARATVGAQNYIKLHRIDALAPDVEDTSVVFDTTAIRNVCKVHNLYPVFVELTENSMALPSNNVAEFWADIRDNAGILRPCLVFGNESHGIPSSVLSAFPNAPVVHIEQFSVMRSLNVSVAAGVVLNSLRSTWDEATSILDSHGYWSD